MVCIVDQDVYYTKAFMSAVALDHAGFSVIVRKVCGEDCAGDADVCIVFGEDARVAREHCKKAFEPVCGRYAGVSAILREARIFAYDAAAQSGRLGGLRLGESAVCVTDLEPFPDGRLLCVYACAGGSGTSCAAIGIGRELARYRGESVLYISMEDVEDPRLFPPGLKAMCVFDTLYRYLRASEAEAAQGIFERLFHTAAACDEYGLYRFAPDDGVSSLARLSPHDAYAFIARCAAALKLTKIVLDFGTRLHAMTSFSACLEAGEAIFIEVRPEYRRGAGKGKRFSAAATPLEAVFPDCGEDICTRNGLTDVGLGNAFGLAVKEICDRIQGGLHVK